MGLRKTISEAKGVIEKQNENFGYVAGNKELASEIWHNHLTPSQRLKIIKDEKITGSTMQSLRKCYRAVEKILEGL